MRRAVLLLATMALAILLAGGVAQAIINGEPDIGGDAHPYVGALVRVPPSGEFEGQPVPLCSGTLISPTVFLTAGHCTEFLIEENLPTYVSFDPTYEPGASEVISGTPYIHPRFSGVPRYDVGVIVLDEPVSMATYGALPDAGLVDTLDEGQLLTAVGYGVRGFDPDSGERYRATVRLLDTTNAAIGDQFIKTTGVGIGGSGEGTCFGDSGGPLFLPDQETIVGVTSFGRAPLPCRRPGYYQRMDLPRVLSWVGSFL